jgi:hypothetical protein
MLVALAPSRLARQNKGANIAMALLDLIVTIAASPFYKLLKRTPCPTIRARCRHVMAALLPEFAAGPK